MRESERECTVETEIDATLPRAKFPNSARRGTCALEAISICATNFNQDKYIYCHSQRRNNLN